MKLAVFFKKANRGLILGAVISLVFTVFAVADSVIFASEKKAIESTIREYVEKSPQFAILSPLRNVWDKDTVSKTIEDKMAENKMVLKKYWTFEKDQWGINQSESFLKRIEEVVTYNAENMGTIQNANAMVQSVTSIVKTGHNQAEVTFKYTGSIKYTGDIQWVLFNAPVIEQENDEQLSDAVIMEKSIKELPKQINPMGEVTVAVVKKEGYWKIDKIIYANISLG